MHIVPVGSLSGQFVEFKIQGPEFKDCKKVIFCGFFLNDSTIPQEKVKSNPSIDRFLGRGIQGSDAYSASWQSQ